MRHEARGNSKKVMVFGLVLCTLLLALSFSADAQQPAKVPRIGWLGALSLASDTGRELLGREIRALGYVDGKNIAIEYRYAGDKLDRLVEAVDVDGDLGRAEDEVGAARHAFQRTAVDSVAQAAPVELGRVIADRLGLTGALGTIAEIDNGVYTGRLVGDLLRR